MKDKNSPNYSGSDKQYEIFEDPCTMIKSFNKINMKDNGSTELKFLNPIMKENTLIFFEKYVDLICEIIQKSYSVWNYDKKKLAISIILFARSSIFNGSNTWNLRLEELTEMHISQIKECFSSICQFFSYGKNKPAQEDSTKRGSNRQNYQMQAQSQAQNPLKPINFNSNYGYNNSMSSSIDKNLYKMNSYTAQNDLKKMNSSTSTEMMSRSRATSFIG